MEKIYIEKAINHALEKLILSDSDLLIYDANERSISHRLAIYLENSFQGWNVDCEYNRDEHNSKRLQLPPKDTKSDDIEAKTVFPDIIVHKRGTNQNLLVIEMKKSTNSQGEEGKKFDLQKLKAFKTQLNYKFAIFIELGPKLKTSIEWV